MRIAILGAGNAGCAVAADLTIKGHDITLIKTSKSIHDDNYDFLVNNNGKMILDEFGVIKQANIHNVTRDISEISSAEIVIVYVQTNYHEELIKRIAPFLVDGQILLINPGYLSTAYVIKYCGERDIIVAEAQSSFIDGRINEPGVFKVGFRNVRNPIGIYPSSKKEEAAKKLEKLNENIVILNSVFEAALHNPNLIVHTVGSIMSIPRIEKAKNDFCMYHEAYTRDNIATWKVLEKLDHEKMDILDALGFDRVKYVDACKFRNSLDETIDAKEVFISYAEMETRAKGPTTINSRYITEDVPQGLVLLESIGKVVGVRTPICTSLIEIASAALGTDLRKEGRTIERLGMDIVRKIVSDK